MSADDGADDRDSEAEPYRRGDADPDEASDPDEADLDASDGTAADAPGPETEDEVFHPLGEEWQSQLEGELADSEYDADLGMEMARDAMRVTKGELSEAEFHDRYHEDVLEEFGVDDRPTEDAWEAAESDDGGVFGAFADALEGEPNRRETMKKMGAVGAAAGLGGLATAENARDESPGVAAAQEDEDDEDDGTQWGMVIDLNHCDGCLSCVVACQQENDWDEGANWMYVLAYEDATIPGHEDDQVPNMLVRPCQHCSDAPCEKVCPTTARHTRQEGGLVLTDYDVCIGCRYCQVACPYGVNYFQWAEPSVPQEELDEDHVYDQRGRRVDSRGPRGVMEKCTFCPSRQDGNMGEEMVGTVACEEACPPQIIHFGDMNDPESRPREELAEVQQTERDDDERVSTWRLLEDVGTNPNVVYIGDEPGADDEQIPQREARERGMETAVAYDEIGLVDQRKDVTDERTLGFGF